MEKTKRLQYWDQVLNEQSESGLSKKDFCSDRGIEQATFYYWQRRLQTTQVDQGGGFDRLLPLLDHELSVCLAKGPIVLRSGSAQTLAAVIKELLTDA